MWELLPSSANLGEEEITPVGVVALQKRSKSEASGVTGLGACVVGESLEAEAEEELDFLLHCSAFCC